MPGPTTQQQGESTRAWQWLMNGWHALREKAVSALTYFSPRATQTLAAVSDGGFWPPM